MNPLFLLFGLLGAGAVQLSLGKSEDKSPSPAANDDGITGKNVNKDDTTETDAPAPTDPEPVEEENPTAPEPEAPTVSNPTPTAPEQTGGTGSGGGSTEPVLAEGTVDVIAGRVATLAPNEDDIVSVKIVSGVEHGRVTVNPDNTFALVMTRSDFVGQQDFTYEITHSDGSTSLHQIGLNVTPGLQDEGWGTGEKHYMLATDDQDRVIVETGENHTKVYISGSSNALSLADIASANGLSVSQITGSWLAENGYGQSEETALDIEAGMDLWKAVTPKYSETSNWLLLERGYEYDFGTERLLERGANGEDELHPLHLTAWGEGADPEITSEFMQYQESTANLVVQDVLFSGGVTLIGASNIMIDSVSFTAEEFAVMQSDGISVRNSDFIDVIREASKDGGDWEAHSDRIQAMFAQFVDGLMLEGNFFDHSAWEEGYTWDGDGSAGQAPSMFSHNIYFGHENTDVTLRDTITMRAASIGAQVRSGGFLEDNLFLDNNGGFNFHGGGDERVGNYTLFTDNVVTSGAHKDADLIGAYATGGATDGELSSLVDNIITHLMDPNNPDEAAYKIWTGISYTPWENHYYDDTIVWNWEGSNGASHESRITEMNVDGLDPNVLNQTTIQLFTEQLLGIQGATIDDLANFLRAQAEDGLENDAVDADLINRFFQEGFGIATDIRSEATTLRFVPNDLADGVRWDNRLNWDTEDLPGLYANDNADLGGNEVVFGSNSHINTLDFGPGGTLIAYGGRLTLDGGMTAGEGGGELFIERAGQVWTNGSDGSDLTIDVTGGRFANTGNLSGADLTATGGQAILATGGAEYDLDAGHTMSVGGGAKAGFDGDDGGMAILDMHEGATLAFTAGGNDLGSIEEFRSGAFGDAPDVQSGIDLGDATLEIDLSGLTAEAGTAFTLMDADEIVGLFNDAVVGGLGARNATIVIDYETDSVTLELSAGNGAVSVQTVGDQSDVSAGNEALWDMLTADQGVFSETQAAMLPGDDEELLDPLLAA